MVKDEIKGFLASTAKKLSFTSHYSEIVKYFDSSSNWARTNRGGWINSNRTLVVSGRHPNYELTYNY